jgi:hypothetical protein
VPSLEEAESREKTAWHARCVTQRAMTDRRLDELEPISSVIPRAPRASSRPAQPPVRFGFLGSGLRGSIIAAIVATGTIVFLFWGGPLWTASDGASHVWRIVGSYLVVVPLVLAALALARRATPIHALSSVGIVWSAKLVITASLYAYLAPGSATRYAPERTWDARPAASTNERTASSIDDARAGSGTIAGTVRDLGNAVPGVAVIVSDVDGPADSPRAEVGLVIEQLRYSQAIYRANPTDRLFVANYDAVLHTFRMTKGHRAVANVPLPAGGSTHAIAAPEEPGIYELSCQNHESERAMLVVGRPLLAVTDDEGNFELGGVPAGEHEVLVLRGTHIAWRRAVRVAAAERTDLTIVLEEGSEGMR